MTGSTRPVFWPVSQLSSRANLPRGRGWGGGSSLTSSSPLIYPAQKLHNRNVVQLSTLSTANSTRGTRCLLTIQCLSKVIFYLRWYYIHITSISKTFNLNLGMQKTYDSRTLCLLKQRSQVKLDHCNCQGQSPGFTKIK